MSNQHQPSRLPRSLSFTVRYSGKTREIFTDAHVSGHIVHNNSPTIPKDSINSRQYRALWDTGATASVITQKIVDELGLKPIGMTKVHTASHSDIIAEVYLVSIFLPNTVAIPNIKVTKGNITGHDMLIGMDIISQGDFAITYNEGKTTFSFRVPSSTEIDFVQQKQEPIHSDKISRNSPCPCGSGKKYKKCCGKV